MQSWNVNAPDPGSRLKRSIAASPPLVTYSDALSGLTAMARRLSNPVSNPFPWLPGSTVQVASPVSREMQSCQLSAPVPAVRLNLVTDASLPEPTYTFPPFGLTVTLCGLSNPELVPLGILPGRSLQAPVPGPAIAPVAVSAVKQST